MVMTGGWFIIVLPTLDEQNRGFNHSILNEIAHLREMNQQQVISQNLRPNHLLQQVQCQIPLSTFLAPQRCTVSL